MLERAECSKGAYFVDSKDPKNIVCGDIAPVQLPGKTWKKSKGVLLDHEWDQSRMNAVTPSTHLILEFNEDKIFKSDADNIVQVTRSGLAVTLVNLSLFEPSTTFRAFHEVLLLRTLPTMVEKFQDPGTKGLVKNMLFVVDNGPGEQPSSPMVQMLLVRLKHLLGLSSVGQVSFAEYNSKRNFVERVHAEENKVLSRHGPFASNCDNGKVTLGSQEHKANMETMANDVIQCLSEARFGGKSLQAYRGMYLF